MKRRIAIWLTPVLCLCLLVIGCDRQNDQANESQVESMQSPSEAEPSQNEPLSPETALENPAKAFYENVLRLLKESDEAEVELKERMLSSTAGELMIARERAALVHIKTANKLGELEAPLGFEESQVALVEALQHRMKATESLASADTRSSEREEFTVALKGGLALLVLQMRDLGLDEFVNERTEVDD